MLDNPDLLKRTLGNQGDDVRHKMPYIYRADVVANGPPLLGAQLPGTIRIKVAGIHEGLLPAQCPAATPAYDLFGSSNTTYLATIPEVGTQVYCFCDGGEQQSWVYFAFAPRMAAANTAMTMAPGIKLDSTKTQLLRIDAGTASIYISTVDGSIIIDGGTTVIVKGSSVLLG